MIPPLPELPDDQRASGRYRTRFEDITQDGRLHLEPIVASVGAAVWAPMLAHHPLSATFQANGIRAVFTRLAIEATDARLSMGAELTATGAYQLAHERDEGGNVVRLYLNMWTEVRAPSRGHGELAVAGRLFAEHVLTRPLAPPEERRVTGVVGLELPRATYKKPPFDALLELPEGGAWLDADLTRDATPAAFGVVHTDINQHVNSLVYPRLFEDAALRRFAGLGKRTTILGRTLEIAFRKPFFAGQSAAVSLRAFTVGEQLGAVGAFVDAQEAGGEARPHAFVRLGFST